MAAPDPELHAKSVLGLTELAAGALPPRVEQLWRMDGFAGDVPFTNPMFVPLGDSPDMGLVYEAVAQTVDRHPALPHPPCRQERAGNPDRRGMESFWHSRGGDFAAAIGGRSSGRPAIADRRVHRRAHGPFCPGRVP